MDHIRIASTVMAALELLPAEPSDLTAILVNESERRALLARDTASAQNPLTTYLCERIELGRVDHWHKELEQLTRTSRVHTVVAGSPDYPLCKAGYWNAPPILFANGEFPQLPSIAIVGSRETTQMVLKETRQLSANLAQRGTVIVSGLAHGIDTAAHLGALDVDGITVAIIGTGIERIYPHENTELAQRISARGVVASQFAPSAPCTGSSFLLRNCVIAGFSDVSLVMDARSRSGSRHEVEQAISYGRKALFWEPTLGQQRWAAELVNAGLGRFVASADEVHAELGSTN